MARYKLLIKRSAAKELEEVSRKTDRRRLVERIQNLANHPRPAGSEKLAGTDDKYRLRAGRYRVLYLIDDAAHTVTVVKVAHRREAYR